MRLFLPVFISILLVSTIAVAQPTPIITPLDYQLKPTNKNGQNFTSKLWKEGDVWHEKIYGYPDNHLYLESFYKDEQRTIKHGLFFSYYAGGKLRDSGRFENNQQDGIFRSWHEDGKKLSLIKYDKGVVIDTALWWDNDGKIKRSIYADKTGKGSYTDYWPNGQVKLKGQLIAGKNEGEHIVYEENGTQIMRMEYKADSLVSTTCTDKDGKPLTGDCIYEKEPEFKGGALGWRRFLEQNLDYPKYARKRDIQGIVKVQFFVSKTGELSDFKILSSPDESLSNEVLRLMEVSPKWKPAIELNKPVAFRHIQSITFRLQ